jgi:hypothetical protein
VRLLSGNDPGWRMSEVASAFAGSIGDPCDPQEIPSQSFTFPYHLVRSEIEKPLQACMGVMSENSPSLFPARSPPYSNFGFRFHP